jgi:hypothetical protein
MLLLVAGLAPQSQAQDSRPVGPWKVARSTRGDTSVVRTLSGSVWGDKVRLVEELRIGTREGDGPDAFGFINGFALFPDGVLAVFDETIPALRLFTPDGKHLRTLGRDGAGPGEYRNQTLGLAVDRDGVLLMYDPRNARINRWKRDGTVLPSWLVASASRLYTDQAAMQVDTSGTTYLKVLTEAMESGKEWKIGLLRLGPNGVIRDTLTRPPMEGEVDPARGSFSPQKYWYVARAGEVVTGFSGVYGIGVAPSGRGAVRIERSVPRVTLAAAERANYQAVSDARSRDPMARSSAPASPVPAVKPYYRQLQSDLDGRIWVRLHTKGEEFEPPASAPRPAAPAVPPIRWRERVIWDVFERNGTYLGQLELPRRTQFSEAKGDLVWAIQRGADDEEYIVRFRITRK